MGVIQGQLEIQLMEKAEKRDEAEKGDGGNKFTEKGDRKKGTEGINLNPSVSVWSKNSSVAGQTENSGGLTSP